MRDDRGRVNKPDADVRTQRWPAKPIPSSSEATERCQTTEAKSTAKTGPAASCRRGSLPQSSSTPEHVRGRFVLEFDEGTTVVVRGSGLIGREPVAVSGAHIDQLVKVIDETASMSRTHLAFGVNAHGLWIQDYGSTNGSRIEIDGHSYPIERQRPVPAPSGSTVQMGTRRLQVRNIIGGAVIGRAMVDWGAATHVGAARQNNQDAHGTEPPVFVVADGMGGHAAGDIASREVVHALLCLTGQAHVTREMLLSCLAEARVRIGQIPAPGQRPPGTTLSGVIVTHDEGGTPCWMVVNVGDSRTYRLDAGGFRQVSVDHSIAQELVDAGMVTTCAARLVPFGNRLTRAVVAGTAHLPDVGLLPMQAGDRILVCSDGLTHTLDDMTVEDVLRAHADPRAAANELVELAVGAGGGDDVTAVVVDAVVISCA
jgi:PPM family protein phosphatase